MTNHRLRDTTDPSRFTKALAAAGETVSGLEPLT
jgi:hypothetical protein